MVSLQTVLMISGLGALFLFRNQIGKAIAQTGKSLGAGVGGAFGGALGSTVSGFQAAFMSTIPEQFRTPEGEFRPLLGTREEFEGNIAAWWHSVFGNGGGGNNDIQTPDQDQSGPDQTVTPATREFSDMYTPQTGRTAVQVASTLDPQDPRLPGLTAIASRVQQPESFTLSPLHYRPDNMVGVVLPDNIDQAQEDQTVTPATREFSDMYTPQTGRSVAQVLSSLSVDDPRRKGLLGILNR